MRNVRHILLAIMVGMLATLAAAAKNKDLLKAISQNNPALVNMALKSGDNPNLVGEDGDSPLMAAVRGGKYKAAKALIKAKADLSFVDTNGMGMMHVAADNGDDRTLLVLLTAGLDPNSRHEGDGLHPIHRTVLKGHTDALKVLLNAEVSAMQPTADGRLPMDLAADKATQEVLKKFGRATAATPTPDAAAATGEAKSTKSEL